MDASDALDSVRIVGSGEVADLAEHAARTQADHVQGVQRMERMERMPTGFPSPAEDMAEAPLDLQELLVRQPAATFFVEMAGDALVESGISAGDVLVVDRSLPPSYGALVVVALDGVLLARHYCPDHAAIHLLPAHPDFAPISVPISASTSVPICVGDSVGASAPGAARCQVWGVVTGAVRRLPLPYLRT